MFPKQSLKLFSNTSILVFGAGLAFLTTGLAARILGPEEFGLASYVLSFSGLLSVICSFGYQFRFAKHQQKFLVDANELHKSSSLSFCAVLFVGPAALFLFRNEDISWWLYIYAFVHAFFYIIVEQLYYYFNATGSSFSAVFSKSFMAKIVPFILILAFYSLNLSLSAEIFVGLLTLGFMNVVAINIMKFRWSLPHFEYLKSIRTFYVVQLLYFIPGFILRILYVEIASLKALGFLTIGLMLSQIINLFTSSISNQLAPEIRERIKHSDNIKIQELLEKSAFFPSLLMIAFLVFIHFNYHFMVVLLGDNYVTSIASDITFYIILGSAVNTLTGATGTILMLSNRSYYEIFTGGTKAVFTISIFLLLYETAPLLSVPIALAAGEIAANACKAGLVYFTFRITPWSWKNFFILLTFLTLLFCSASEIVNYDLSGTLSAIIQVLISIIAILSAVVVQSKWN